MSNINSFLNSKVSFIKTLFKGSDKLTNDRQIVRIIKAFGDAESEIQHSANYKNADLGFAWLHYGFIRQQRPKHLLCIGSRYGFIPAVMAQACKDNCYGMVDFVDAGFDSGDGGNYSGVGYWKTHAGRSCFAKFGLGLHIRVYVETTKSFKAKYAKKKYDYIYIDGNHSYDGVKFDFESFWPLLNQGGFCVLHDIYYQNLTCQDPCDIPRFWKQISKKYAHISFGINNYGLGIIEKT